MTIRAAETEAAGFLRGSSCSSSLSCSAFSVARVGAAAEEDAVRDASLSSFRPAASAVGVVDGEAAAVASEDSAEAVVAASVVLVAVAVLGAAVAAPVGKEGRDRRMTKQALSRT